MLRNHTISAASAMVMLSAWSMVLLLPLAGCATNKPGVTNKAGQYDTVVNAPADRVTRAATDVLEDDYKFTILSSAHSTIDGRVEAQTAQGTKVWVWVERQADNNSKVSVRVGAMGDERLSMEILDKIKNQSKTLMQKLRGSM